MKLGRNYGWKSDSPPSSCGYIVPMVLETLQELNAHTVLDIGAGNGALCKELLSAGYEVAGVEPDPVGISIARRLCPGARLYQLSVCDAPEEVQCDRPEGFDVVVSTEVLEHLYAPRELVAFASAVVRDGGYLLITTPYHGYLKNLVISIFNGWDRHADPLWDGGHIKLFSRRKLSRMLEDGGFEVCRFGGVGRVPWLWKSMVVLAVKK